MRKAGLACWVAIASAAAMPACASQVLDVNGASLAPVVLHDVTNGVIEKQVALGGDVAELTHVVVQFAGLPTLMRDRQGVYQPWDMDIAHLADTGFPQSGGAINFKIFNQDLSDKNFPLRVTLYYRANGALKFGYFDVMRTN